MLDLNLLDKATDKGIITAKQQQELIAFFKDFSGSDSPVARDEAPRFFRSFNDLFIGLGVGILGFALFSTGKLVSTEDAMQQFFVFASCAGIFWLLAEWITKIRRINFPSIIISLFFSFFLLTALLHGWEALFISEIDKNISTSSKDVPFGVFAVVAVNTLAMGAFLLRFRLPFSLLLFAAGVLASFIIGLLVLFGGDALAPVLRWIFMLAGLSVFACAMYFDFQDPLRSQRTSDHGFWLHLLAAPIITHSVLYSFLQPIMSNSPEAGSIANVMVVVVLGMFVVFSVIALIIDRRALLISSLGYASAALGYIIYKFNIEGNLALILTLILIATLILTLGTGWYKLRGFVFKLLPDLAIFKKLPPLTN